MVQACPPLTMLKLANHSEAEYCVDPFVAKCLYVCISLDLFILYAFLTVREIKQAFSNKVHFIVCAYYYLFYIRVL
jgi:hypothetical protein